MLEANKTYRCENDRLVTIGGRIDKYSPQHPYVWSISGDWFNEKTGQSVFGNSSIVDMTPVELKPYTGKLSEILRSEITLELIKSLKKYSDCEANSRSNLRAVVHGAVHDRVWTIIAGKEDLTSDDIEWLNDDRAEVLIMEITEDVLDVFRPNEGRAVWHRKTPAKAGEQYNRTRAIKSYVENLMKEKQ